METETYETETENNVAETETEIVRYVRLYAFYTLSIIAVMRMTGIKSTKLSVGNF